jgi:hypothetical protein
MALHEITANRFEFLYGTRRGGFFDSGESAWFASSGEKEICTVSYERGEGNWSYSVLGHFINGYRWVAGDDGFNTQANAMGGLQQAIKDLTKYD